MFIIYSGKKENGAAFGWSFAVMATSTSLAFMSALTFWIHMVYKACCDVAWLPVPGMENCVRILWSNIGQNGCYGNWNYTVVNDSTTITMLLNNVHVPGSNDQSQIISGLSVPESVRLISLSLPLTATYISSVTFDTPQCSVFKPGIHLPWVNILQMTSLLITVWPRPWPCDSGWSQNKQILSLCTCVTHCYNTFWKKITDKITMSCSMSLRCK